MILRVLFSSIIFLSFVFLISSCSSDRKKNAQQQPQGKGGPGGPGGRNAPVRADAYIVKTKLLLDNIEIPGTLVSNETTEIHPEVAGRITGLYVKEGSYVNKGALLVKLNDADLQAQKR